MRYNLFVLSLTWPLKVFVITRIFCTDINIQCETIHTNKYSLVLPAPRGGGGGALPRPAPLRPGSDWISLSCSKRISSLLSGTRYFLNSARAKAILAWDSAGGARADTSTCSSSERWEYLGSRVFLHSSS